MIGPLAQRQIHLISNVEAMRQAVDAGEQQTREVSRKQAADARLAEASSEVPQIPEAQGLRTEERQARQHPQGHPGAPGAGEDEPEEAGPEAASEANPADRHLDFLA